jgi:hypothetical protein
MSACHDWALSQTQISAVGATTMQNAAKQAVEAASADPKWLDLKKSMQFIASLPETGNSATAIAEAQSDLVEIQNLCALAGVTVGN